MMDKNNSNALVIGAGISGIRTALDLAQQNYHVTLIDKSPAIGGILSQLDYQFPSNHCGMCKMLPLVDRDSVSQFCLRKGLFHENIRLILSCELCGLTGEPGNFTVRLHQKPTWVDPDLCVGCGLCEKVCTEEIPDCFNESLSVRKAIFLPVPHAIPNSYVIDMASCTRCGACEAVCPTHAIELSQSSRKAFHILVVDDELSIRDSLKEWLEEEDFSVDMAASGQEALDLLSQKEYHLMLTDIKMPQMSGVELLEKTVKDHPDLNTVMMTAYATVETAVEAMKIGAMDYLIKPFDPDTLVPMVIRIFQDIEAGRDRELTVDTVIFSHGTSFYDPADEKNIYGYGIYPNVLTHIEFERMLSHSGPFDGMLRRLDNDRPVRRIAWLQCVGSRDIQKQAEFCSNICCMIAIKEAILTREHSNGRIETAIFYMDMRTCEKSFQRYHDAAISEHGVRFERCRIHSLSLDKNTEDLVIRHISMTGELKEELFDLVVLSVGQRPGYKTALLAKTCDLSLNPWGFIQTRPFAPELTSRDGIMAGGSVSELKDISRTLIHASAAALNAANIIHSKGKKLLSPLADTQPEYRDVSREPVNLLLVVCRCKDRLEQWIDIQTLTDKFMDDPSIQDIRFIDMICTRDGWEQLEQIAGEYRPNRLLICACHPYLFIRKIRDLAVRLKLDPAFVDVADIMTGIFNETPESGNPDAIARHITSRLGAGAAGLVHCRYPVSDCMPVFPAALVIGGGIAGMTAAIGIAEQGYQVVLVEKTHQLGGNLTWLNQTLDGLSCRNLLEETLARITKQPLIRVMTESQVIQSTGTTGHFITTIENEDKTVTTLEHGCTILATGGNEAATTSYKHGLHDSILTQKELETRLETDSMNFTDIHTIVMIQCVDSRQEPRNYCSQVCCPTALKQARAIKQQNPDADIYFLYRDMMTCGFTETFFTQARNDNMIFISYTPDDPPRIEGIDEPVTVTAFEPVLGRPIQIQADLVVLATGIVPAYPDSLAAILGTPKDADGFFREAESRFRPLDALKDGVFACGLVHGPRSITESIATAQAAASRALSLISKPVLAASRHTARVRESLCSLCLQCIDTCPYGARILDEDRSRVQIIAAMCQGCGACAAICPNNASVLQGFSGQRMFGVIDAAFETLAN